VTRQCCVICKIGGDKKKEYFNSEIEIGIWVFMVRHCKLKTILGFFEWKQKLKLPLATKWLQFAIEGV